MPPGTRFRDAGRGRVVMGTGLRFPPVLQPSYPLVAFHYLMRSRTDIIGAAALVIGALVLAGCTQQAPGTSGSRPPKSAEFVKHGDNYFRKIEHRAPFGRIRYKAGSEQGCGWRDELKKYTPNMVYYLKKWPGGSEALNAGSHLLHVHHLRRGEQPLKLTGWLFFE